MAKHEYTGLALWGFIDGRHGGEASAKELARYARNKGIQLIAGVSGPPLRFVNPRYIARCDDAPTRSNDLVINVASLRRFSR